MAGGFEKSVNVEDKGNGIFEISYKGLGSNFQRTMGVVLFFSVAPIGCTLLSASNSMESNTKTVVGLIIGLAALWALIGLRFANHKIEITPDGLKFNGTLVAWSEIDTVGYENRSVFIVCSGTRVQLGDGKTSDIASSVMTKITNHSPKQFS